MKEALAVGVMSGTSLDGISTALVRLQDNQATLVAFRQEPYSAAERGSIIDAMARGTPKDVAFLHVALGERFAGAVLALLAQARVSPKDLSFIASHGQTIWHEPGRATFQLGDGAVLAERVGVQVVSDFRARDVAAGGLLDELLRDPYFDQPPPKSTGRERFGIEYADKLLARVKKAGGSDNDAVATATALTAETIARAVASHADEIVVSGGGAKNPAIIERLATRVQPRAVVLFDQLFFDGEAKEAVAFAFLGHQTLLGKAGNLPAATGARGPRILGHITPA